MFIVRHTFFSCEKNLQLFYPLCFTLKLKVLFLWWSFGVLLIKRKKMEKNPLEFCSSLLCMCLHLQISNNDVAGRVTMSLSFCCIIDRSSAKAAVIAIISDLDNYLNILGFFSRSHVWLFFYHLEQSLSSTILWIRFYFLHNVNARKYFSDYYSSSFLLLIKIWRALCYFWSSIASSNIRVYAINWFLLSSECDPLPLMLFLLVSYVLADILVILWCLLWYWKSVFRHPRSFFFLFVLSKQNQLIFGVWGWILIYDLCSFMGYPDVPVWGWECSDILEPHLPACHYFCTSSSTQKD